MEEPQNVIQKLDIVVDVANGQLDLSVICAAVDTMEILYLEKNVNRVTVQVLKIITLLPVVSTLAANSYANARRGTPDLNAIDAIMGSMEDPIRNVYLATVIHMAA